MTRPCTVLWTSEPLAIGKHEWRIVVGDFPHLVTVDRALGRSAPSRSWRRVALRCEKTVNSFQAFVALACAMGWLT